jgi:hypothetical protein
MAPPLVLVVPLPLESLSLPSLDGDAYLELGPTDR